MTEEDRIRAARGVVDEYDDGDDINFDGTDRFAFAVYMVVIVAAGVYLLWPTSA